MKWSESHSVVSDSWRPHGLYSPWNSPGQNSGVCSLSLLQGIFPTQGSNPGLPHCRQILYQLSHKQSPRILEWVAYPFSCGCFRPSNGTGISCIAGGFFTNWAIREAHHLEEKKEKAFSQKLYAKSLKVEKVEMILRGWVSSLNHVAKELELQLQLQHQSFKCIFRVDFL